MLRMSIEITTNTIAGKITVITPRETLLVLNSNQREGKRNKVAQKVTQIDIKTQEGSVKDEEVA